MKLAVVGLGKLGAPMLAVLRSAGHEVVGVDSNESAVKSVREGLAPVEEAGLQDLLDRIPGELPATTDLAAAVRGTDAAFVVVPTPSLENGRFDLRHVLAVVEGIGHELRRSKPQRYVVTISSTVMPGSIDGEIRETLEAASGMHVRESLGLVYNPQFIALGSLIDDMTEPDLVLIGETASWSGQVVADVQASFVRNKPVIARMNSINAEIAKLALNSYITMKISFANLIGEICEVLPGANADVVTAAVGADSRIGSRSLRAGGSFGGPCFPRDNKALSSMASDLGVGSELPQATDLVNRRQATRLVQRLRTLVPVGSTVAVLGTSYKEHTGVADEAFGIWVSRQLLEAGYGVRVFDNLALDQTRSILGAAAEYCAQLSDAVNGSSALVLASRGLVTTQVQEAIRSGPRPPRAILDCWNILDEEFTIDQSLIVRTGRSPEQ